MDSKQPWNAAGALFIEKTGQRLGKKRKRVVRVFRAVSSSGIKNYIF